MKRKHDTIHTRSWIELKQCFSDSNPNAHVMLAVGAFLFETIPDDQSFPNLNTKCDGTEAFRELCEGRAVCQFDKSMFTSKVPEECARKQLQDYITFSYICEEGRSLPKPRVKIIKYSAP